MLFLSIVVALCSVQSGSASLAVLTANGYDGIVVSFSDSFANSSQDCSRWIQSIQDLMVTTSQALCTATESAAFFGNVYIMVPPSWNQTCQVVQTPWVREYHADFRITEKHPISGNSPITFQYGGCGQPGLATVIPIDYLSNPSTRKGEEVLHEWAHYRYGVFDERGVKGDRLYPASYRIDGKELSPTSCTNEPMNGLWTGGESCNTAPDSTCDWTTAENTHIVTSLMYRTDFSNMTKFCSNATHDENSPNKHNWFCAGRSVEDVIFSHSDFKKGSRMTCAVPSFTITSKPLRHRFFFILDASSSMDVEDRFKQATEALAEFIYFLDDGSWVTLVSFADLVTIHQTSVVLDSVTKKKILSQIDNLSPRGPPTALQQALELALNYSSAGNDVILLTAANQSARPASFHRTIELFRQQRISTHLLAFGTEALDSLQQLTMYGSASYIPDWTLSSPDPSQSRNSLSVAISSLQSTYSRIVQPRVKVFEARHHLTTNTAFSNSFTIDTPGSKLIVSLSSDSGVGGALSSSTGQTLFITSVADSLLSVPVGPILNPQPGTTWNYTLYTSNEAFVNVDVWVENPRPDQSVEVRAWTSAVGNGPLNPREQPVALYSQVLLNSKPVLNAAVVAKIYGVNESGVVELITNVTLKDSGIADVTAGDGIYSGYVTSFSSNSTKHTVIIEVTNTATSQVYTSYQTNPHALAGSSVPGGNTLSPVPPFRRYIYGVDFLLADLTEEDLLPPAGIQDLKLSFTASQDSVNVTLTWTAPMDDYGQGIVVNYFLVTMQVDMENPDLIFNGSLIHGADNVVRYQVTVGPDVTGLVRFRVRAMDGNSNVGPLSNPASLLRAVPQEPFFDYALFWGLMGPAIAVILILLVLAVYWLCKKKKVRMPKNYRKQTTPKPSQPTSTSLNNVRNEETASRSSSVDGDTRSVTHYINQSYEQDYNQEAGSAAGSLDPQLAAIIRDNASRIDLAAAETQSTSSRSSQKAPLVYTIPTRAAPPRPDSRQRYANIETASSTGLNNYGLQDPRYNPTGTGVSSFTPSARGRTRIPPPPKYDADRGSLV